MIRLFERCGCVLMEQSRFELNLLRWWGRYGIAAVEGIAGVMMRVISPKLWHRLRDSRHATSQQIGMYVSVRQQPNDAGAMKVLLSAYCCEPGRVQSPEWAGTLRSRLRGSTMSGSLLNGEGRLRNRSGSAPAKRSQISDLFTLNSRLGILLEEGGTGIAAPLLHVATRCLLRGSQAAPQSELRPDSPCHAGQVLDAKLPGAVASSFHMGPGRGRRVGAFAFWWSFSLRGKILEFARDPCPQDR